MSRVWLDRDQELELFANIATGKVNVRILLLRAKGGMGKSSLLREFIAHPPQNASLVVIDFKSKLITLHELISQTCDAVGWDKFPTLTEIARRFASLSATVNVTGNTLLGQNRIIIEQALNAPDETTREQRRVDITNALFEDLRELNRVTFVLDTFEDCDDFVNAWLTGVFMSRICHAPNTAVILAGRCVPEPATNWHALCQEIYLQGIATEYFVKYAQRLGLSVHPERIRGVCEAYSGRPLPILTKLQEYALQERHA
jgi:hypothetical protein